jgi:release factor glutamine methyltransferase
MSNLLKKDLIELYKNNGFTFDEANVEIDFAIEVLCGISTKDMLMGIMPDESDLLELKSVVEKRALTKQPIAQILGKTIFMGYKFEVSENTLIPRPETELLVSQAIKIIKENNFKQVLDIGTGSGCIACMLAKKTTAQVLGVDISNDALKISLNNAMHLDLMNKALCISVKKPQNCILRLWVNILLLWRLNIESACQSSDFPPCVGVHGLVEHVLKPCFEGETGER